MATYSVNLSPSLEQNVEQLARQQGISLEQFILTAVTEKVNRLNYPLEDPAFPTIVWHQGASGGSTPILRGTRLRVQTIVIAARQWGLSARQIAEEYDLTTSQVEAALAFYAAHQEPIDQAISAEQTLETANV